MKVLKFPDPFLFKVVPEVTVFDEKLKAEAQEMIKLMHESNGVGLAANQVGLNKRIFVMQCEKANPESLYHFVNPKILECSSEKSLEQEGCLSFPKLYVSVERNKTANLEWQDLDGKIHQKTFYGLEAICVQHELDHLNGIVFINHLSTAKRILALGKLKKLQSK